MDQPARLESPADASDKMVAAWLRTTTDGIAGDACQYCRPSTRLRDCAAALKL